MPIQDTPVQRTDTTVEDTPITPRGSEVHSEQTDRFMAAQASFIDSYVTGNSVLDNYNYYSGVINKAQELNRLSAEKASQDAAEVSDAFVMNPYGTSGSIEEQAAAVQEALNVAMGQATNPDVQATESMMGDSLAFDNVPREAAMASMYKILNDAQGEVSFLDEVMDFGKALLPFVSTIEGYQLTGDILGQDDAIKAAIAAFRRLPAGEQARLFPHIRDELVDIMGEVGAAETLANFIAPLGSELPQRYGDIDTAFDAIDLTGVGIGLAALFQGIRKGYNVVKTMDRLGNTRGAAEVNTAALADEHIAATAGMSQETALGNAMPFDISIEDISHTGGLAGPVADNLREYFGRVDATAEDIMSGDSFLREGILNTRQRAAMDADAIERLQAEQAENIRITERTNTGTKFEYNIRDEDGNISEEVYEMNLDLNDAGYWDQSEGSLLAEWLGSNTIYAKGTLRGDVDEAQRIDYLTTRINNQLHLLTRDALKPIGLLPTPANRASHARVNKALVEGDEWKNADGTRGRIFGVDDLRSTYGLNDNEISAYYRLNRLYNNIFNIRNFEKRQEYLLHGYQNVALTRSGESVMGKPFETSNDAALSIRQSSTNHIYDADADEILDIRANTSDQLNDLYNSDKVITRLEQPYDLGNGRGRVMYIATSRADISDLPQIVLNRKVGYVPRIYDDVSYFVKEYFDVSYDIDKVHKDSRTLRFFNNRKEAEQYIDTLVAKELEGITDPAKRAAMEEQLRGKRFQVRGDREEEILSSATGEVGHGTGGLYTGARSQDDILFGLEGTKPVRLNSFESLTRNIGNLSRFVSLNQFRLGLEQRWINTANRIFASKNIDTRVTKFNRLPSIAEASDEVRFLNNMYDQIRDWQRFPTFEERAWQASVQKVFDWAANRGYRRTAKLLGYLGSKDPIAVARSVAFHSLLGMFNPAHFWVQAQGMMNAFALGLGKYAARSQLNMMSLTALDIAGDSAESIAKIVAKAGGTTADELMDIYRLWEKTGYRDSVLQTADHAAVAKGFGLTREIFRKLTDGGLIFYRNGELLNRRLSFLTAVERWKEANPGKLAGSISDEALKGIMDDANNMMLNLTRANRANWQKGILSLPTQFFQVTAKFMETMIGLNKNFTAAERGRMFASQLLFYGTAGIPLVNYVNNIITESFGITQQDIDNNPTAVKAWNDGIWGVISFGVFGADIELASRGSLLRSVSDQIDNWFIQESSLAAKLLGAFGSTQTRFWDSFAHNLRPFMPSYAGDVDWVNDTASLIASPFLATLSSTNNIKKAVYMNRLDAIYSRNGRLLDTRDYSFTEEMAQALGFQTTHESEAWDLIQLNEATESLKRDITTYVLRRMNEFALVHPDGDYTEEEWNEYRNDLAGATAVLDPDEMLELNRAVYQSITSGSARSREIQKAMRNIKETTTDELLNWRNALTGSKILRIGEPTEEEE